MYIPATVHTSAANVTLTIEYTGSSFEVLARFATEELANEYAAQYPKSAKMAAYPCTVPDGVLWMVGHRMFLSSNGTTGDRNETGLRRARTIMRSGRKLGTVELGKHACVTDLAELDAALAA